MLIIDFILLAVLGGVTWYVSSEGGFGAAVIFVSATLSALLALNFFEPLAMLISGFLAGGLAAYRNSTDLVAFVLLFGGVNFGLRVAAEKMMPTYIHVQGYLDDALRWGAGLATGYLAMAVVLVSLHVAMVPREWLGFRAERKNFLGISAPDRQLLGFMQYVSGHALGRRIAVTVQREPVYRLFDGPYYMLPQSEKDANKAYPNTIWSSFPIRYASRRELLVGAGKQVGIAPAGPAAAPSAPAAAPASPSPNPSPPAALPNPTVQPGTAF